MKHLKSIGSALLALLKEGLSWLADRYLIAQLWLDRKVLKRYFGIETPFYKMWHKNNVEYIQKKLDYERKMREGYELGMVF